MPKIVIIKALTSHSPLIHWDELTGEECLLDIRNPTELAELGTYPHPLHIPLDELRQRPNELPRDPLIVVSCQVELRGHTVSRILSQQG